MITLLITVLLVLSISYINNVMCIDTPIATHTTSTYTFTLINLIKESCHDYISSIIQVSSTTIQCINSINEGSRSYLTMVGHVYSNSMYHCTMCSSVVVAPYIWDVVCHMYTTYSTEVYRLCSIACLIIYQSSYTLGGAAMIYLTLGLIALFILSLVHTQCTITLPVGQRCLVMTGTRIIGHNAYYTHINHTQQVRANRDRALYKKDMAMLMRGTKAYYETPSMRKASTHIARRAIWAIKEKARIANDLAAIRALLEEAAYEEDRLFDKRVLRLERSSFNRRNRLTVERSQNRVIALEQLRIREENAKTHTLNFAKEKAKIQEKEKAQAIGHKAYLENEKTRRIQKLKARRGSNWIEKPTMPKFGKLSDFRKKVVSSTKGLAADQVSQIVMAEQDIRQAAFDKYTADMIVFKSALKSRRPKKPSKIVQEETPASSTKYLLRNGRFYKSNPAIEARITAEYNEILSLHQVNLIYKGAC